MENSGGQALLVRRSSQAKEDRELRIPIHELEREIRALKEELVEANRKVLGEVSAQLENPAD